MTNLQETELRDEAARLKVLPVEVQREIIDLHRSTANDSRATRTDRERARQRADALTRHLKLK